MGAQNSASAQPIALPCNSINALCDMGDENRTSASCGRQNSSAAPIKHFVTTDRRQLCCAPIAAQITRSTPNITSAPTAICVRIYSSGSVYMLDSFADRRALPGRMGRNICTPIAQDAGQASVLHVTPCCKSLFRETGGRFLNGVTRCESVAQQRVT